MDEELLHSVAEKAVIETATLFFVRGGISDVAKAAKEIAGKVVDALPRHPEPPAKGSIVQALAELREAGGNAWGDVPDVEAELGRKPEPPTPVWSSERPKVTGFYFCRFRDRVDSIEVDFFDVNNLFGNEGWYVDRQFAGPIPEPKEAAK